MSRLSRSESRDIDKPVVYTITLQGNLDRDWSAWFDGMVVTHEGENTILTGEIRDQAALRSILIKAWDLNQTLVSVNQVQTRNTY